MHIGHYTMKESFMTQNILSIANYHSKASGMTTLAKCLIFVCKLYTLPHNQTGSGVGCIKHTFDVIGDDNLSKALKRRKVMPVAFHESPP